MVFNKKHATKCAIGVNGKELDQNQNDVSFKISRELVKLAAP